MITSLLSAALRAVAYRDSVSVSVEPRSVRPRNRTMTTEFREASVTSGSRLAKVDADAKKRLP